MPRTFSTGCLKITRWMQSQPTGANELSKKYEGILMAPTNIVQPLQYTINILCRIAVHVYHEHDY